MMQTELFQVSSPNYSTIDYSYFQGAGGNYQAAMDVQVCSLDFSSSIEDFSDVSSSVPFTSNLYSDEFHNIPSVYDHQYLMVDDQVEKKICEWMQTDESAQLSQSFFVEDDSSQPSLILPCEDMEIDTQLSIMHLLKAYGEAMENEQKELADEIPRRLREKANPIGATVERLAYYLIKDLDKEEDFLRQESRKNYDAAYKAFYQIFPFGRFAHFTANSVILEAMPDDAETVVHIIDFDIGGGVQWPPLIEEFGRRGNCVARLTSLRRPKEEEEDCFEDTKRRLLEHAESCGVRLMVEEMDMESLVRNIKKTKNMSTEWLAFNCMVDLPHMRRSGSSSLMDVINFIKVAKDSITQSSTSRGIVILGDGSGVEKVLMEGSSSGFGPYFEGQVSQFHALCESMESHFPHHLTEARIAMECLFVAPNVSHIAGFERWEEISREGRGPTEMGLEGRRMSKDSFLEAKEVVREGESLYWVRVEGESQNKMVLGYMGTPLVSVSSWR